MLGLLLHADHAVVGVQLDDAVEVRELRVVELVDGERARSLAPPERDVVGERELEQVVGGDHEQAVVAEPALAHCEPDVAEGAEPGLVARGAVVVDGDPVAVCAHRSNAGA